MSYTVRDTCRLCDAPLPDERVLDLGETPLANALHLCPESQSGPARKYPLYLKQCTQCGHVQLPVVVDPKLLFPADYPYASATGEAMREHLKQMAHDLLDDELRGPKHLVVEIGSNDGCFLDFCQWYDVRTIGIDPASKLAAQATRNALLTIPTFFDEATAHAIESACGTADLIVANNVFAHADDLHEVVVGVKTLLAPEGRFVFEVGYLPDVLASNNFGTVYHEHLSYHTLRPLIDFFARYDLGLYDAHRVNTQGGSVRCFVRRGPVETPKRLFDLVEAEESLDLSGWQSRVDLAGKLLAQQLEIGSHCGPVAGYGCSAKSTTMLHLAARHRDVNPWKIDFICDDAPTKQGRYSPGLHIPIVPGSWLEEKQPVYCVSLSGNFSQAFKAAHPGFRGGWIEPDLAGEARAA